VTPSIRVSRNSVRCVASRNAINPLLDATLADELHLPRVLERCEKKLADRVASLLDKDANEYCNLIMQMLKIDSQNLGFLRYLIIVTYRLSLVYKSP
jgi:hypothetical protein